jgi:hypothetical protein
MGKNGTPRNSNYLENSCYIVLSTFNDVCTVGWISSFSDNCMHDDILSSSEVKGLHRHFVILGARTRGFESDLGGIGARL